MRCPLRRQTSICRVCLRRCSDRSGTGQPSSGAVIDLSSTRWRRSWSRESTTTLLSISASRPSFIRSGSGYATILFAPISSGTRTSRLSWRSVKDWKLSSGASVTSDFASARVFTPASGNARPAAISRRSFCLTLCSENNIQSLSHSVEVHFLGMPGIVAATRQIRGSQLRSNPVVDPCRDIIDEKPVQR